MLIAKIPFFIHKYLQTLKRKATTRTEIRCFWIVKIYIRREDEKTIYECILVSSSGTSSVNFNCDKSLSFRKQHVRENVNFDSNQFRSIIKYLFLNECRHFDHF